MAQLRFKGLVAMQRGVREQLARGVTPAEIPALQRIVGDAVSYVRRSCVEHGVTVDELPAPTRAAFRYLCGVALELPSFVEKGLARDEPAPQPRRVRIPKINAESEYLLGLLADAVSSGKPRERAAVQARYEEFEARVRKICARAEVTPANLSERSKNAFVAVAFLAQSERFAEAVATARSIVTAVGALVRTRAVELPAGQRVSVRFVVGSNLYRVHVVPGEVRMTLNIGFVGAPDPVLEAVARSALRARGASRRPWETYAQSAGFQRVTADLDLLLGGVRHNPRGRAYDLDSLFDAVNAAHFGGEQERPTLAWSRVPSRRLFGKYLPTLDHIEISSVLDDPTVPEQVVAYILFHELLHKRIPSSFQGERFVHHSAEFRVAERQFPDAPALERWIARFAQEG